MLKVINHSKIYFAISAVIILAGIIMFLVSGFAPSISFNGGFVMTAQMSGDTDIKDVSNAIRNALPNISAPSVQLSETNQLTIKTSRLDEAQINSLKAALSEKYSLAPEAFLQAENVAATKGLNTILSAIKAILIALFLMLLYAAIRYEFKTSLVTILCLIHDVLIILSLCVLFRSPADLSILAAVLFVLVYRVACNIILASKIKENQALKKREPFAEIAQNSIVQSFGIFIAMACLILTPAIMLCILGTLKLRLFSIILIAGILTSTYSSLFFAGPVWVWFKNVEEKLKQGAM